jgi:hypothetical protein
VGTGDRSELAEQWEGEGIKDEGTFERIRDMVGRKWRGSMPGNL